MRKILFGLCIFVAAAMLFASCQEKDSCYIVVRSGNPDWGTATGGGTYKQGATVEIRAVPRDVRFQFSRWHDGDTTAFRTITVNDDATYVAIFDSVGFTNPEEKHVKVTFDGEEWYAAAQSLQYAPSSKSWRCIACQNQRLADGSFTYPMAVAIFYNTDTGVTNYQFDTVSRGYDRGFMRLEYIKNHMFNDDYVGARHGDFWAYSCSLNITAFDATTLRLSAVIESSMADIYSWSHGAPFNASHSIKMEIDDMPLTAVSKSSF